MKRHLHRVRVFFACQTCAKKRTKSTIPSDKGGVAQIDRGRLCANSVSPPHLYQATTLVIDEALNGATHADHHTARDPTVAIDGRAGNQKVAAAIKNLAGKASEQG